MNIFIETSESLEFCCEDPNCPIRKLHIKKGGEVDTQCERCGLSGNVGVVAQNTRPDTGISEPLQLGGVVTALLYGRK